VPRVDVRVKQRRGGARRFPDSDSDEPPTPLFHTNPTVSQVLGRILRFDACDSPPVIVNATLVSPTSMALDRHSGELFVTEIFAGRITRIVLQ
jgi:hypothetical protein